MKYLYYIYQYLIALPLLILGTLICAITTITFFPFKKARWLYWVQVTWARSFYWLLFIPVKVTGGEKVNKKQSYVFVSNHQSMYDAFLVYGWLPNMFKWLMKQEVRKMPFVGLACQCAGHVYVDRRHPREAAESLKKVEDLLRNGLSTTIFAEGTRTKTGEVGPFKRGAFQVALDMDAEVVPISISGNYEVMPIGARRVEWHPVTLHIGEPMKQSDYASQQEFMEAVRQKVIEGCIK